MNKYLVFFTALILLVGCSGDSPRNNNPYIPNYSFSANIDINLPLYSGLNTPINPISFTEPSGISMIVMKISDTDFRAWNDSCPNQYPSACSKMGIHGVNAKCNCDNIEYSLFTGVGSGPYAMIPYHVQVLGGNVIRVYN
jgi:hypothetical protein